MSDLRKKALEAATLETDKIRLMTSDPRLKDRIHIAVEDDDSKIFWYIKFNILLDPKSINNRTMKVMQPDGLILDTEISYDLSSNIIVISPLTEFKKDECYILKITKKVLSSKGQKMKEEINILFKLTGGQVSEFQVLKKNVKVPKPRYPSRSERKASSKVYSVKPDLFETGDRTRLRFDVIKFNPFISLLGMSTTLAAIFIGNIAAVVSGLLLIALGIFHLAFQFRNKSQRSKLRYNWGVLAFNRGDYQKAQRQFAKAYKAHPENEMNEYALDKVKYYL